MPLHAELIQPFVELQLSGDRRGALRFIESFLDGGGSAHDLLLEVLPDAQRRIGLLWEQDRISVAQEHSATAISQFILAHVYQRATMRARNGHVVMVACVAGEQHDFPARLLADALDLAGYEVRFLGADVPADELADALRADPPDVLALSITMPFNADGLRRCVARAREVTPQLRIAVGGHACEWSAELAREVGAQMTARNAREFLGQVDALLGISGMPA